MNTPAGLRVSGVVRRDGDAWVLRLVATARSPLAWRIWLDFVAILAGSETKPRFM